MPKHCPITGLIDCDCGACESDDEPERPELTPKFTEPDWPEGAA